ncbi:DNA glycosylase [Coprinopsis marcescibilis]|uniref:Endonuclease III homolog n=1 Tax=Coprinopsis marcescibilis TaxID=230819 RepID=A0A5C3L3J3_COPMA|nr:DNA glycosylase [Coprinopsis marcescibilis]
MSRLPRKTRGTTSGGTTHAPISSSTSTLQDGLVAHKSTYNSSVTLFSLNDLHGPSAPTSAPVKLEEDDNAKEMGESKGNSNVTPSSPSGTRRSKRVKLENSATSSNVMKEEGEEAIPGLEDIKLDAVRPITPRRSLRRTKVESTKLDLELEMPTTASGLSPLTSEESVSPAPTTPSTRNLKGKGKVARKTGSARAEESPSKKKGTPKPIRQTLDKPHPAPKNWEEVYFTIRKMREGIVAPVDTMGCDQAQFKETDPKNQRYATLVSLMLSSQTKDEVTDAALTKLRSALGGTLSIEAMINAQPSTISEAIAKVGFWRRKTEYLKQTAVRLRDDFESDVPKTVDELCSLPGVGPKMAFLVLQVAWNLNHGIGVDVHVHRITNRLGWHNKPTKNPEETRLNLQSWLPKEHHKEINHMLVGFGQVVCTVNPKCDQCQLSGLGSSKALCPSARTNLAEQKKKKTSVKRKLTMIKGEDLDVSGTVSGEPAVKVELEMTEENGLIAFDDDQMVKSEQTVKQEEVT